MQSASLNALPSPAVPAEMVESPLLNPYLNLVAACYELRKVETDPSRLLEIERARSLGESVIAMIDDEDPQMQVTPPAPQPMGNFAGGPPPQTPMGQPAAQSQGVPQ